MKQHPLRFVACEKCGAEFVSRATHVKYCQACKPLVYKVLRRQVEGRAKAKGRYKTGEKIWECWCSKGEHFHYHKLFWGGRGEHPPIVCKKHQLTPEYSQWEDVFKLGT